MIICILNSGTGSRLSKFTQYMPKGLVPLNETTTILGRQLTIFQKFGHFNHVITTGYLNGKIQEYIKNFFPNLLVNFLYSENFSTTNYITSLELLREKYKDEIIIIHGDIVFEESVARDLLDAKNSVVVIDSTLPLPEKDFKARIKNGRVVEIGIDLFGPDCFACQPVYHLVQKDWNIWQDSIHNFCSIGMNNVYAENAFNVISSLVDLYPLDVQGRFCMEVDNEDDLNLVMRRLGGNA